MTMALEGSEGL